MKDSFDQTTGGLLLKQQASFAVLNDLCRAACAVRNDRTSRRLRFDTIKVLNTLGVEVIDADSATLPPALADRYLALKAAGKL